MSVTITLDKKPIEINRYETITMSNGVKFDICENGAISNVKLSHRHDATFFGILALLALVNEILTGGITEFKVPKGVTSIGPCAFKDCTSLKLITIPDGVISIGNGAFWGCTSLTSITIPSSVKIIELFAFYGCNSLKSITIPNSVTSILRLAFCKCLSLTSITIPSSVTSIGAYAFGSCISLKSVIIEEGVTTIGEAAFRGCTSLESITIPKSVKSISPDTFEGCTSLKSVIIGEGVTSIGEHAFSGCTRLESITIPSSVTSIGDNVFKGCDQLGIVICDSQYMADLLNSDKEKYFGKADATTVAVADNPTDNQLIEDKINNKIDSITDEDYKTKLRKVLDPLSEISFKEKVLIYKCLREGSFNYEEFYQEFMQLADSESGWSKAFANLRNRVISNYGCESQKELVNIKGRVPDALLTNFLRRNELAALAITSQSGLQGVTVPTTGKTEPPSKRLRLG